MITHIVLLAPAPGAEAEFERVGRSATALADQVDGIVDIHFGPDTTPADLGAGYTHALVVTFVDAAARDAYLPHAAHLEYAGRLSPVVSKLAVIGIERPDPAAS